MRNWSIRRNGIPFALGLAKAQPDMRVLLFTGDGDTLMSLGSIATIANHPVSNLTIVVLDNESYVETGSQPTATAGKTDLQLIAEGSGISNSYTVTSEENYEKIMNLAFYHHYFDKILKLSCLKMKQFLKSKVTSLVRCENHTK